MKIRSSLLITSISFLLMVSFQLSSQEATAVSPYLTFQYFKNSDNSRYLQTTLSISLNRMEIPLPGMEISFFSGEAGKTLLGTALTDEKGVARLELTDNNNPSLNNEGLWAFSAEFKGNDTIEAGNSALSIKDVILEMDLRESDSIKTVSLKAYTSEKKKEIPVVGEVVMVYVPRMFSLLPVGEATLDENGTATLEFPSDLPGDSAGNLIIISKFEENPTFGNVETRIEKKWGIPASNTAPVTHRALWTKTPPRWMIITLSILLAGVWGHYLFAIISLIMIKRDSNKKKDLKTKTTK